MGVRIAGKRKVTVKKPVEERIVSGVVPLFEKEGWTLMAAIQPVSAEMKQKLYGEEKSEARLMLTDSKTELKEGYGLCVERTDGVCDFQVAEPVERWSNHQRAVLKRIGEEENGF
ncbi:MAG: hypothetical protein E7331_04175 [Clostridiales bacterium]|nr:hypothetical protein [Clostridiales bacterium]